jgi:hypothetical protein
MRRAGGILQLAASVALALVAAAPAPVTADILPGRKKPRPTHILSGADCVGVPSLSPHEIRMAILTGLPAVRACYRAALARKPGLSGTLKLELDVSPEGRAQKVTAKPPALADATLQRCAVQTFGGLRFKKPRWAKLGTKIHVVYPLRFTLAEVDGPTPPTALSYLEDDAPHVGTVNGRLEVTLPHGAQAELAAAFPQHRLPRLEDLAPGARGRIALPLPFALTHDLDSDGRDELALVLVGRQAGTGWRLVVLRRVSGAKTGRASLRVVTAAEGKDVLSRLQLRPGPDAGGLFLTRDGQCYCDHRCLSVASDRGRAFELEWDGSRYRSRLEHYLPR